MKKGRASIVHIHRTLGCGYGVASKAVLQMRADGLLLDVVHGEVTRKVSTVRRYL
jgi:hypothetical protein